MSYQVTQADLDILRQGKMQVYLKAELLNENYKILESLEGNIISDNFSQDKDSVQRRSYSCDMIVTNASFSFGKDKKIWIDKRIRINYGLWSLRLKKIIWYPIGIFAYVSVKYTFSNTERKISLNCADLMAIYDGTLNGQVGGYGSSNSDSEHINQGLKIPAGEDIRSSIIATLNQAKITKYNVEDIKKEIPYDLEFSTGVTYQEIWQKICELYDNWEYFFDTDGTFIWRQIPTCLEDNIVLNDEVLQGKIIDENTDINFSEIYNVTEVWGKVLELENDDRYSDTSTYNTTTNTYNIDLELFNSWEDIDNLTMIGFKVCENNLDSPNFTINNWTDSVPIVDGNGDSIKADTLEKDTIYVIRLRRQGINASDLVNLIDITNIKNDTKINLTTGKIGEESGTDYITGTVSNAMVKVTPNMKYTFIRPNEEAVLSSITTILFYDSGANLLSTQDTVNVAKLLITTPSNCYYIRFVDRSNTTRTTYNLFIGDYTNQNIEDGSLIIRAFLLGQFQCYGKYISNNETDPDNPFNVDNLGYEILKSVDYDGLSDDAACYNQAEYLTYSSTAMQDTITLNMLLIPWLEVNQKIEYTPQYNKTKAQYIIKNMSWSTGAGTMTLTLYKFIESFSYVYNRRYGN